MDYIAYLFFHVRSPLIATLLIATLLIVTPLIATLLIATPLIAIPLIATLLIAIPLIATPLFINHRIKPLIRKYLFRSIYGVSVDLPPLLSCSVHTVTYPCKGDNHGIFY